MNYNELATQIYEQNKAVGWWDDPDRCFYECLQLVSTEVAEATEGERKNLMDDHLPHRRMGEVELADALIRVLDIGGKLGLEYPGASGVRDIWLSEVSVGRRHLFINEKLLSFSQSYTAWRIFKGPNSLENAASQYGKLIDAIVAVSDSFDYDMEGALREKLEYNKTRADHKRVNREKENGKKF